MSANAPARIKALYESVAVDVHDFAAALRRCSATRSLVEGRRLHTVLAKHRHDRQTFLGNLLVHMYGSCDRLRDARSVFDRILHKNVYSWNIVITAYAQRGDLREANSLFLRAARNEVTWNAMIGFFAQQRRSDIAAAFHARMPQWDVVSGNAMVAAYAQEGHLLHAKLLFSSLGERDVVSWNTMIAGLDEHGDPTMAGRVFEKMPSWNPISLSSALTAYAHHGHLVEAMDLWTRLPDPPGVIPCTALVVALGESGEITAARSVFDRIALADHDSLSCSMMILAYAHNGDFVEARRLFRAMDLEGIPADSFTFVAILEALGNQCSARECRSIHALVAGAGIEFHPFVVTALINTYGKCGSAPAARGLFDRLPGSRDVSAWNAIMAVYSHSAHAATALHLFRAMLLEGVLPDQISFVSALAGASHAGSLRAGWEIFVSMAADYDLAPGVDHFACVIDLLGRAARMDEAVELVASMPMEPNAVCWRILLCACRSIGDEQLGDLAADALIDFDGEDASPYFLLGHTYNANGKTGSALAFNKLMRKRMALC